MENERSATTTTRHLSRREFLAAVAAGAGGAALAGLTSTSRAAAASRSYHFPIDSAPHTRTWMAWPDSKRIWGSELAGAQANIALVARTIAKYEPVIVCANRASVATARAACGPAIRVIGEIPVNDCWMRDSGPIFRVNGRGGLDVVGLNFNGWGNKQVHGRDALVARRVAALVGVRFTAAGFVSEGGAIECNGNGTLMATRSSVTNPNRNPYHVLSHATNARGVPVKTSKLIGPIWDKIRQHKNQGFVDSYANYYVCNGAVIAAQFGDAHADAAAAATLARLFPGRAIEQLNIDRLGNGGGGVHCVTQPQPVP